MATTEVTEHGLETPKSPPTTPSIISSTEPPPSLSFSSSSLASPSSPSSPCHQVSAPIPFRRRGFLRPQATTFADSARNRQSVMNLGSIAHIQHYFARTGLLEGKGGQITKGSVRIVTDDEKENADVHHETFESAADITTGAKSQYPSPTLSLYRQAPIQAPPPRNLDVLRLELQEALADARSVLGCLLPSEDTSTENATSNQGWHEVEGTHVLDLVTLALRAVKDYYVCHPRPARLFNIRSERQLRADAHKVMDTLKVVAGRNFRGGFRRAEIDGISQWVSGIEDLLKNDEAEERSENSRHELWPWITGNWTERERDREWSFLKSFEADGGEEPLPTWLDPVEESSQPTEFLLRLRTGITLIKMHNAMVQASKKRFGEIMRLHIDTEKPYRRSENLKYWIKAAELRWEVKLNVPVAAVAAGGDYQTWKVFDEAILEWCKAVRQELTGEYGDFVTSKR